MVVQAPPDRVDNVQSAVLLHTFAANLRMNSESLESALQHHAAQHDNRSEADDFLQFLHSAPSVFERHHAVGHFTGSAWLVSADGARVLLTHHRKLGRWLQLGGHADGDADLARVALREAEEESGLRDLVVDTEIFDLDRHLIPARGSEPAHWHYDVRYVVRARGSEVFAVSDESLALAWKPIRELVDDPQVDASLQRMARKWLAACGQANAGGSPGDTDTTTGR